MNASTILILLPWILFVAFPTIQLISNPDIVHRDEKKRKLFRFCYGIGSGGLILAITGLVLGLDQNATQLYQKIFADILNPTSWSNPIHGIGLLLAAVSPIIVLIGVGGYSALSLNRGQ